MGDLAIGLSASRQPWHSDEAIEVLVSVGRDASRRLVDHNGGRKHLFSPFGR
jgi:hypothetical protein